MLNIAKSKSYPVGKVQFSIADTFAMPAATAGQYSACFAGFLWSHIKREEQADVLAQFARAAGKGSLLVLIDNNYVEGSSQVITKRDDRGNTCQTRNLTDGSTHLVRKNFPSESSVREQLRGLAGNIQFINL